MDGYLLADGSNAGGGVYVSVQKMFGAGSVRAAGGSFGGGGGGRIAIHATDMSGFDLNNVTAAGGVYSSAGTIYLHDKDEPAGTLMIIDQDDGSVYDTITPIGLPGQTRIVIRDRVVIRGRRALLQLGWCSMASRIPLRAGRDSGSIGLVCQDSHRQGCF